MAQKQNPFAIQPANLTPTSITAPSRGMTKAQERSYHEASKQLQVMNQQGVITKRAQDIVGEMDRNNYRVFAETAEYIWQIKDQPGRPAELQQLMDGMALHCAQRTAAHLEAVLDAGVVSVGEVVRLGTYPPTRERPGLFGRVKDE